MKVLLTISVALNLLVIGAIGSRAYFGPPGGFHMVGKHARLAHPAAMQHAGRHLMWKLPREKRRDIRQMVKSHRTSMQPQLQGLAQARLKFAKLIEQPYEPAQFDAALATMKTAEAAVQQKSSDLIRQFIEKLSPQERMKYGKILQKPARKRWFKRGQ